MYVFDITVYFIVHNCHICCVKFNNNNNSPGGATSHLCHFGPVILTVAQNVKFVQNVTARSQTHC